jgi:NDP-sugar pyrophosphorylase family protein
MNGAADVVGIGLAGGSGVRARPLTLKAPGYLRSKAAMSFLGRRLIRWVIQVLSTEGIKQYFLIAHGKENRYQIKVMLGYGEEFGVDVMYSPVKYDSLSTGSADSTLRMLEYWDIGGAALVFPTDSIIDFDLEPMIDAHRESGAAVTIAAMTRAPEEVAEKYGVMLTHPDGGVFEFVEKPSLGEIREHFQVHDEREFDNLPLLTNAGFYLVDASALRRIAEHPQIAELRRRRLDFGKDLLPWMVGHGYPVHAHAVRRIGDLGNVRDYIDTMVDALHGNFESLARQMGPPYDPERHVWIAPESLQHRDDETGLTLEEKIAQGIVTIGPGVTISESNLDDDVDVRSGAVIQRSEVRDGAIVGMGAQVRDAFVGSMSEIRSSPRFPTTVEQYVALGDEVVVYSGVNLKGDISIYPRLKIPGGIVVPHGAELTGPADVLRYL